MLDLPSTLDKIAAGRLLEDEDTDAMAALVALTAFIGDDFLDEDGQPLDEDEIREMLQPERLKLQPEPLTRICGLLYAISGDEFTQDPTHFRRMVGAIVEGGPFVYEDDNEEPTLPDVYWALYLVELLVEDEMLDELGPRVQAYISRLAEEEAEDSQALADEIEREGLDPEELEPYVSKILIFRRTRLAADLRRMRYPADALIDLDPELAEALSRDPETT